MAGKIVGRMGKHTTYTIGQQPSTVVAQCQRLTTVPMYVTACAGLTVPYAYSMQGELTAYRYSSDA
jgi:hypothetical protein